MKITIENTNGQKYLMTGEEFVERLVKNGHEYSEGDRILAAQEVKAFLSTYEEEPIKEGGCGAWRGKDSYDCDRDGARTKPGTCDCGCHGEAHEHTPVVKWGSESKESRRVECEECGEDLGPYND